MGGGVVLGPRVTKVAPKMKNEERKRRKRQKNEHFPESPTLFEYRMAQTVEKGIGTFFLVMVCRHLNFRSIQ